MRRALIYSLALHVAVAVIAYTGGLVWRSDPPAMETAVVVEVVPVAEKTNVPDRPERPEVAGSPSRKPSPPEPDESRALTRAAPKPKGAPPRAEPAPPPRATPAPEPAAAPEPAPPPEPALEPAPQVAVREPPAENAPTRPDPKPTLDAAEPKRKPEDEKTPPPSFESVLKTVEALGGRAPAGDEADASKHGEPDTPAEQAASDAAAESRSPDYRASEPVSMSEIDMVRRQIERCWNLPAGARGADNMVVSVRVEMNIDGTPGTASVIERERMQGDPYYRAAAESALRAVLNPRCHPFSLPREKFDSWKTMTLVFDPKEMFGT